MAAAQPKRSASAPRTGHRRRAGYYANPSHPHDAVISPARQFTVRRALLPTGFRRESARWSHPRIVSPAPAGIVPAGNIRIQAHASRIFPPLLPSLVLLPVTIQSESVTSGQEALAAACGGPDRGHALTGR